MVGKWKRILYSIISAIASIFIFGIAVAIESLVTRGADPSGAFVLACLATSYLGIPCWILALPIILWITNIEGWRLWGVFALGASLGPLVILGIASYTAISSTTFVGFAQGSGIFIWMAMGVSSLATLLYLLLLRRAQLRKLRASCSETA